MSSFFIRPKFDKNAPQKTNPGKKSGKKLNKKSTGKVHGSKPNKAQKRKFDRPRPADDDEITSDEETLNESKRVGDVETDEDELITPQEKKLKLAKQYLEEIEEEEKRKADGEVEDDIILGRLREDVLKREGKFRKKVADTLITSFNETDFTVLKCKEQKLAITCLVVSSDDKLFAGSKDCVVVKWCLSSMRKLGIIPPRHKDKSNENLPAGSVLCLAVSQDNRYLAVGDTGSHIQIWDPKTLVHIFTFKGHRAAVTGLSFCRINQHLYSASKDKTVKVWSLPERAYVETLFGHQEPISSLDVLAKNRVLTSGGDDTSVRIWKIEEESQLIFNGHKKSIDAVKRLSDVHFVTCGIDGLVCVWANNKKKPLHRIQDAHGVSTSGEPNWIISIACLPNSEVFASGSSDGAVKLWRCADNFRSATILATIPVKGFVNAMSFTADQTRLVVGVGQEHRLGRWSRLKEAKNALVVVQIAKPESGADEDKVQNGCNDSDASTDS